MNGCLVAENNKALFENTDEVPAFTLKSIHIDPYFWNPASFHVKPLEGRAEAWVQAMEMYDGYFKRKSSDNSGAFQIASLINLLKKLIFVPQVISMLV